MYNANLKFEDFLLTCTMNGDGNFSGKALTRFSKNMSLDLSGELTSPNLKNTVSFTYFLGPVCTLAFFDDTGKMIDKLISTTSFDGYDMGGGEGKFF